MLISKQPTIGIIGAGRLGTAVARQSLKAGYNVIISNSRPPESLDMIIDILIPGARAASSEDVAKGSDIVILALPFGNFETLHPDWFAGKTVIDATNYWQPTEGFIKGVSNSNRSTSEIIQQHIPKADVVKTLNHVAYNEIEEHSTPSGSQYRRAMVMAGNDQKSKDEVAAFIDRLGFDLVNLGDLAAGKQFQPDTNLFNMRMTKQQIIAAGTTE